MALMPQLPPHADDTDAFEVLEEIIRLIGPDGYHPDTPMHDYVVFEGLDRKGKPSPRTFDTDTAKAMQKVHDECWKLIEDAGGDFYDLASAIVDALKREDSWGMGF